MFEVYCLHYDVLNPQAPMMLLYRGIVIVRNNAGLYSAGGSRWYLTLESLCGSLDRKVV